MKRRKQTCPSCKELKKKLEVLEKNIELLRDMVSKLAEENALLKKENRSLKKKIKDLEEKLNINSSNSSKPPSSDLQEKQPKPSKPKSKRKRGAQPGHADQQRKLYPLEQVDEIHQCKPDHCERCFKKHLEEDQEPLRFQKVELPPIKPKVTEYQVYSLICSDCGHRTTGALPKDVGSGVFGPRIQAITSLLSGAYRLSKREIKRIMSDVFNVDMSLGSVCNLENATSKALEAPVEEAKEYVKNQPVVHLDETGWREAKQRAWLWTAVTAAVVVFVIRLSRGSKVAKELIGEGFRGIVNSDRWSAYSWIDSELRQLCWAHPEASPHIIPNVAVSAACSLKICE